MKKTMVKLSLIALAAVVALSLMGCPVTPGSSSTTTTTSSTSTGTSSSTAPVVTNWVYVTNGSIPAPIVATNISKTGTITLDVWILASDTNLYEPVGAVTNTVYLVGAIAALYSTKYSNWCVDWTPGSKLGELTYFSTVTRDTTNFFVYRGVFDITNTGAFGLACKFVNGTPASGGDWANEEQRYDASTNWAGTPDRSISIPATDLVTNIVLSNQQSNAVVPGEAFNADGFVIHWKGVGPTYFCQNVSLALTFTNMTATYFTNGARTLINSNDLVLGTAINLWGNLNGWSSSVTVASNVVLPKTAHTFFFKYWGPASLDFQLRANSESNVGLYTDNQQGVIPFGATFIADTNSAVWHN